MQCIYGIILKDNICWSDDGKGKKLSVKLLLMHCCGSFKLADAV